jgi:hypothetical protein
LHANPDEARRRLRTAIEQFTRAQQSAARVEEAARKALDAAVTARGFASLKRREAVAYVIAAKLEDVRRRTVKRVARCGIQTLVDAAACTAHVESHNLDSRQTVVAIMQRDLQAYTAAAAEAEAVVGEHRAVLEGASAAVANAVRAAAAAHDALAEEEAAERIALDVKVAAGETTKDAESSLATAEAAVSHATQSAGTFATRYNLSSLVLPHRCLLSDCLAQVYSCFTAPPPYCYHRCLADRSLVVFPMRTLLFAAAESSSLVFSSVNVAVAKHLQ